MKRIIIEQAVAVIGASYISKILFAVATFLIVRHFDVSTYGTYATAFTFVSFFAVFLNFGINDLMVREVAVHPEKGPELLGNNVVISLTVAAAVFGVILMTMKGVLPHGTSVAVVAVLGVAVIIQALQMIFWSLLQVNRRIDLAGLGQAFFAIFWIISVIAVVVFGMGLRQLVLLQLITAVLGLCTYLLISTPFLRMRPILKRIPGTLARVYPFGLSNLCAFVYIQADIFLVSRILGEYEAGLYAAVFRLLLLMLVVPEMVYKTVLPKLYKVTSEDVGRSRNLYNHGLLLMFIIMVPLALVYLLWPEPVIMLLLGSNYGSAAPVLRIFSAVIIIQALIHPTGQQLVALGKQHVRYKLQLVVTAVFIVASLFCIPRFGLYGAAVVNIGARLLLLLSYIIALARYGYRPAWTWDYAKVAGIYGILAAGGYWLVLLELPVWIAAPALVGTAAAVILIAGRTMPAIRLVTGASKCT